MPAARAPANHAIAALARQSAAPLIQEQRAAVPSGHERRAGRGRGRPRPPRARSVRAAPRAPCLPCRARGPSLPRDRRSSTSRPVSSETAQAGAVQELEDRPVAQPRRRRAIVGRRQQPLHLVDGRAGAAANGAASAVPRPPPGRGRSTPSRSRNRWNERTDDRVRATEVARYGRSSSPWVEALIEATNDRTSASSICDGLARRRARPGTARTAPGRADRRRGVVGQSPVPRSGGRGTARPGCRSPRS